MTGKDLIIYILKNNIEDQEIENIFKHAFYNADEVASKFKVGSETVVVWYSLGLIKGIKIGNTIFFPMDVLDPRGKK